MSATQLGFVGAIRAPTDRGLGLVEATHHKQARAVRVKAFRRRADGVFRIETLHMSPGAPTVLQLGQATRVGQMNGTALRALRDQRRLGRAGLVELPRAHGRLSGLFDPGLVSEHLRLCLSSASWVGSGP